LKVLGKAEEGLTCVKNEALVKDIRYGLNKVFWAVWVEEMSYIALHSDKDKERCLALRNLSQVEDGESLEHIICVVSGVLHDLLASPRVTKVAKAVLSELQERQDANSRQVSSGGKKGGTGTIQ
jgi:hypothetical protein